MTFSPLRAAVRLTAFLLLTATLLPPYLLAFPFGRRCRRPFAHAFFRGAAGLTGLQVRVDGDHRPADGTLYVCNHVSYLDVVVLASLIDGIFVAKADVRSWPLFGFLARISQTVFVSRQASKIARERLVLADRLAAGASVILFPEGSSSCGTGVLPFRPGLMSAVQTGSVGAVPVQPVSLVYGPAHSGTAAVSQQRRDDYAWYGDMDLFPHLWRVFGLARGISVRVQFHPQALSSAFDDSRALAKWAESRVRKGLQQGLAGSAGQPVTAPAAADRLSAPPARPALRRFPETPPDRTPAGRI